MSPRPSECPGWALVLRPKPDELLSAWLARSAAAHGQSLHRFAAGHLGVRALCYRDIDAFPTEALLSAIEARSGLTRAEVFSMTLVPYRAQLALGGGAPSMFGAVLPRPHTARSKFLHGQQACMQCLSEGGTYLRRWRLSFVVACEQHNTWLMDACPACDAPLDSRTSRLPRPACAKCHRVWSYSSCGDGPFFSAALQLQTWLVSALDGIGVVNIDGNAVPLGDALRGFGFLLRVDRRLGGELALPAEQQPFRIARRIHRLERLSYLLNSWPRAIVEEAKRIGLSRDPFGGEGCPEWVLRGLSELREVKPQSLRKESVDDPVLAKLRKKRSANWRSHYAHRLVRLAGAKNGS